MKLLAAALAVLVLTPAVRAERLDLDFDDGARGWQVVLDGVMGGRSTGRVTSPTGTLVFTGDLSLENNGGFSQIRRDVPRDAFDGAEGIELRVRGDGRVYTFDVRCSHVRLRAGSYQRTFTTTPDTWQVIRLPFPEFVLHHFGRRVSDPPALERERIEGIGITLADKSEGPFRLEVDRIRAFGPEDRVSGAAATDSALAALDRLDDRGARLAAIAARLRPAVDAAPAEDPAASIGAAASTVETAAARLCVLAIDRGAPLFNAGQPDGCAAVYEITIHALLGLASAELGPEIRQRLEQSLEEAAAEATASDRAWAFRRGIDDAWTRLSASAAVRHAGGNE